MKKFNRAINVIKEINCLTALIEVLIMWAFSRRLHYVLRDYIPTIRPCVCLSHGHC